MGDEFLDALIRTPEQQAEVVPHVEKRKGRLPFFRGISVGMRMNSEELEREYGGVVTINDTPFIEVEDDDETKRRNFGHDSN
jgi:hypothetical protein